MLVSGGGMSEYVIHTSINTLLFTSYKCDWKIGVSCLRGLEVKPIINRVQ